MFTKLKRIYATIRYKNTYIWFLIQESWTSNSSILSFSFSHSSILSLSLYIEFFKEINIGKKNGITRYLPRLNIGKLSSGLYHWVSFTFIFTSYIMPKQNQLVFKNTRFQVFIALSTITVSEKIKVWVKKKIDLNSIKYLFDR